VTPLPRTALALALGASGGAIFFVLGLPLPWMLGALTATMAAALAGLPVRGPGRIRPATVAVIGVMLGSRFTPDLIDSAAGWIVSGALVALMVALLTVIVVPFYSYFGRLDRQTALLAGLPGGLNEMVELGEERGAEVRAIILAHSLRIVITIVVIAIWFRLIEGHAVGALPPAPTPLTIVDALLLAGCAVAGTLGGARIGLPAAAFLGPMILSAVLHATEITTSAPPGPLVVAAQVLLGTILGCRFVGVGLAMLGRAALLSAASTVLSVGVALGFALALNATSGVDIDQGLLAFAPGGVTEMGLIALAIEADAAFVAVHHILRILIVLVLARPLLALVARRAPKRPSD
jgi:membrane AbrB-like protein